MKTYQQCLSCFERQAADVCVISKLGTKETEVILETVRKKIKTFPCHLPPIKMAAEIHNLIREKSGIADPFADIKKTSNEACNDCGSLLTKAMKSSQDLLMTAIQLAIAGNIIDCGAYGLREVTEFKLGKVIEDVLAQPLKGNKVSTFHELINNAEKILYVGDNAGECFFDVPLLELIPKDKLTYAVRGGPVLNDATLEDAYAAGIQNICRIIDTGDNAPGILLEQCSDEFNETFDDSDLIISKGQGNYESLSETTNKTIAFLTKVKCEMIGEDIGYPLNSNVMKIINLDSDTASKK